MQTQQGLTGAEPAELPRLGGAMFWFECSLDAGLLADFYHREYCALRRLTGARSQLRAELMLDGYVVNRREADDRWSTFRVTALPVVQ